jgi:hypothetical protein
MIVLPREVMTAANQVLRKASFQAVRDSDIQARVSLIREDVNKIALMRHR